MVTRPQTLFTHERGNRCRSQFSARAIPYLDGQAHDHAGIVHRAGISSGRASPQARFGVHLCLGDACDGPVVSALPTTSPIIAAIEAIGLALDRPEALEYVHFPLASGPTPPALEPRLYHPLAALRGVLPEDTQIIAGLAHERQSLSEQLRVLDLVEIAIGEPVGIAASCGLARRTPGLAVHVMRRMIELASA